MVAPQKPRRDEGGLQVKEATLRSFTIIKLFFPNERSLAEWMKRRTSDSR